MEVKMINNRPVKIWTDNVEESAMRQIENLTTLPFLFHHLAIMPDVHAGMGMPIGGVLACKDAVIPNAVGVDIGCGMCAVKTNWKVSDIPTDVLRKQIMRGIRKRIPLGMDHHKEAQDEKYLPTGHDIDKMEIVKRRQASITKEVGTLGGGNHFIELQKDEDDNLWIMIHSGSRNLGKQVGDYYNKIAATLNERWHSVVPADIRLPFLARGSKEFEMYWNEMKYCVDFALCNRKLMMERIEEVIADSLSGIDFEPMINIAHNYAAFEHHFGENVIVHRKGATLAREGIIGIIPGSRVRHRTSLRVSVIQNPSAHAHMAQAVSCHARWPSRHSTCSRRLLNWKPRASSMPSALRKTCRRQPVLTRTLKRSSLMKRTW